MTQKQYPALRVVETRPKLIAPYSKGEYTFSFPPFEGTYTQTGLALAEDRLERPTMAQMAALLNAASYTKGWLYCAPFGPSSNTYGSKVGEPMHSWKGWRGYWAFTGSLYTPDGIFIQDNPEIRDGQPFMDRITLEQKLNAKDTSVRFVPHGFKVGEMSISDFAKNPYLIGLAGEEGAEQLARIAKFYTGGRDDFSILSVLEPSQEEKIRVSSIFPRDGFVVSCTDTDVGQEYPTKRFAFGVLAKTGVLPEPRIVQEPMIDPLRKEE